MPLQAGHTEATEAVQHFGNSALPYLLEWSSYEPRPWRIQLDRALKGFLTKAPRMVFQEEREQRAYFAVIALGRLGCEQASTIGRLKQLALDPSRRVSRANAVFALNLLEIRRRQEEAKVLVDGFECMDRYR